MEDFVGGSFGRSEPKLRSAFGGGFQVPKQVQIIEPPAMELKSERKPLPPELAVSFQPDSRDVVSRLEDQLRQLQEESSQIRQQRAARQPFAVESLLHGDYVNTGYHSHPSTDDTMTLEQVEIMKRQNAYKLMQLEAEYQRKKTEAAQQKSGWGKAKAEASPSVQKYMLEIAEKLKAGPTLTKEQTDYKAKFEGYLEEKKSKNEGNPPAKVEKTPKEQLLKFVFKTIDKDRDGQIDKVELLQEMQNNEELPILLGFDTESPDFLEAFGRQFSAFTSGDTISYEDFLEFFKTRESPPKPVSVPVQSFAPAPPVQRALGPPCLLTPSQLSILEKAFQALDKHEDMAVKRSELCDNFRQHKFIKKMLHIDAVQLNPKEAANLETILDLIECDGDSLEDLITWHEFLLYFQTKPKIEIAEEAVKPPEQANPLLDATDLNEAYMQMIMDVFDSIPRVSEDQVSLRSLIIALHSDAQIQFILSKIAREPSGLSAIPQETVAQVFTRMEKEANKNISWAEVVGFFSKRGRPANFDTGYDSDPDIQDRSISPIPLTRENYAQMGGAGTDRVRLSTSFSDDRIKPKPWVMKSNKKRFFAPTVPKPFKFERRESARPKTIKQRQMEELIAQKQKEEEDILKYQYKAQPVPAEVLVPKLESIIGAQEAKREKVRQESELILAAKVKPFSFDERDKEKKRKEMEEKKGKKVKSPQCEAVPAFRANPVPIHATLPIFEQMMKNKEAGRKAKLKKAAEEALALAKMPSRMEQHAKLKAESKPQSEDSQHRFFARKPPNFHAMHKAFNEAMNEKKQEIQLTKVEPFNLNENRKREPKESSVDLAKEAAAKWGSRPRSTAGSVMLPEPRATNNLKKMEEARKKRAEEEKAATDAEEEAERQRKLKYQEAVQRVKQSGTIRGSSKALEEEKQQKLQQRLREQREREKDFERTKQEMLSKVKAKPLLAEKATSFASKYTAYAKAYQEKISQRASQVGEDEEEVDESAQPYTVHVEDMGEISAEVEESQGEEEEAVPYEENPEEENHEGADEGVDEVY